MRGNGDSQGLMEDEYTEQELNDGVEVINWLQRLVSGGVGMMGISWGGFTLFRSRHLILHAESDHNLMLNC